MIPSRFRLDLRALPDFFTQAKKEFHPLFVVWYLPSPTEISQLVVIVPKKNAPTAAERHRLKRAVYAEALPLLTEKPFHSPLQLVFSVNKRATQLSNDDVRVAFHVFWLELLKKIKNSH